MIRRSHSGRDLARIRDLVEDRPVRWHPSGRVFVLTSELRALKEKIAGTTATHGKIQVELLVELRDITLDAIREAWDRLPSKARVGLMNRLPEVAMPADEMAGSVFRIGEVVDQILAAHPDPQTGEYITMAERAALAAVFAQEVE